VIFLTRGTKKSISRIINEEDYNILNEIIDFNNLFNMQLVVYAYKILTKQEILQLKFEMRNAKLSPLNTEGRKEAVFEKFEKNSKYLGIIAIENPVSDHTRESIKALTSAGIKI
jgi:Cation transport ATPase